MHTKQSLREVIENRILAMRWVYKSASRSEEALMKWLNSLEDEALLDEYIRVKDLADDMTWRQHNLV